MAYIPCDWYHEHILGDNCNNKCDECFGNKNVHVCKEDFEVVGGILEKITIKRVHGGR